MLKKHLRKIASELIFADSDKHMMTAYLDMTKHPGWETHKAMLLAIFQGIGNDLLSSEFTKKDASEKDITQRVYYELSEIIKFLLNPQEEAKQAIKITAHNKKMGQLKRKGKTNAG